LVTFSHFSHLSMNPAGINDFYDFYTSNLFQTHATWRLFSAQNLLYRCICAGSHGFVWSGKQHSLLPLLSIMTQKQQIIVPANKRFALFVLLGSILFITIGLILIRSAPESNYSPILLKTIGFIGTAFFSFTGLFCFRKLLDNKPALIINEIGIWNNTSIISSHTIKWSELRGVGLTKIGNEKILFLYLNDNKSFLMKFNLMERLLMRLNLSFSNSPIGIASRSLKYNSEKLNRQLQYRISNWT